MTDRGELEPQTRNHEPDPTPTIPGELLWGLAEKPLNGQDRLLVMEEQGVFGIFDGMGYSEAAAQASETAAKTFCDAYAVSIQGIPVEDAIEKLQRTMVEADKAVAAIGDTGTTATLVQIVPEEDCFTAVYASVGDSRLYLFRDDGLNQITVDEGEGRGIYNFLGRGDAQLRQTGAINLKAGDRLMLCSDGITGDLGAEVLSENTLTSSLEGSTPQEAANKLLQSSRKRDDKSVIVIDIPVFRGEVASSALMSHLMKPWENFQVDLEKPLEKRGGYNVVAGIAAGRKEFLLLDLRNASAINNKRIPFGESAGSWNSDFLLIDETFFGQWGAPGKADVGFKGIRTGDEITFGRRTENSHRFEMPPQISRKHFSVSYDGQKLSIVNFDPMNGTTLTYKK